MMMRMSSRASLLVWSLLHSTSVHAWSLLNTRAICGHERSNFSIGMALQNTLVHATPTEEHQDPVREQTKGEFQCKRIVSSFPTESARREDGMETSKIRDPKFLERNKHWIVIVDDEEPIRQSVGDFLYDSGYQVTACADAEAAVQVCSTVPEGSLLPRLPSCIVSDIRMPGGPDGLQLLQWIRQTDTLRRVPVVLLTAKGLTKDRIEGYRAGADVYLPKPFLPEELLSIVDNSIARRQQMMGQAGTLADLQQEMASIKGLLKNNGRHTVKQTDVYLTPAEREIVDLLCKGYTNAEIADERGTSKQFVGKSLKKIYSLTETKTRTELLKWAIQTGYVNPKM